MICFYGTVRLIMLNCLEGCEIRKTVPVHVALSLLQNHSFSPFSVWVGFHHPLCITYRGRLLYIGNQVNGQQQSFPESQQTITVVTWLHTSYWMEKWYWQINWHLLLAGPWIAYFKFVIYHLQNHQRWKWKWPLNERSMISRKEYCQILDREQMMC